MWLPGLCRLLEFVVLIFDTKIYNMQDVETYSWGQFDKDVSKIVKLLKKRRKKFDGVWGPPRGGLPLAVILSHALGIPFLSQPRSRETLIVDDIAGTGKTLNRYAGKNYIVTLFYCPQSTFVPDLWIRSCKKWVVFPWEKSG